MNHSRPTGPQPPTVLVTGASGGIGRAIVERFADRGARVVAADLDGDRLRGVSADFADSPGSVTTVRLDVTDSADRQRAIDTCIDLHGSLDGLVNCAGVLKDARLASVDAELLELLLDVNLVGPLELLQQAVPHLAVQGGAIVNVASRAWLGTFGSTAYSAAKGGLVGATRSLALELGPRGITVNCVAPGFIETAMTARLPDHVRERSIAAIAVQRPGTPQDVAGAVHHLVTDATYTTGQTIVVCGGRSIGAPMVTAV